MANCPKSQEEAEPGATLCASWGANVTEARESQLVDGRYAIELELGRGAMGVVHLARDVGLGRHVALKLIYPRFARDARLVERFRRGASALASIRHEHVVEVYAFGNHEGSYYFAMEYVAGKSLERIITSHAENNSFVPISLALPILSRVASRLEAVHTTGQLHRDVKPYEYCDREPYGSSRTRGLRSRQRNPSWRAEADSALKRTLEVNATLTS